MQDHFFRHYNIRLSFPDLPCVATKAGVNYPMEVCSVAVVRTSLLNRQLCIANDDVGQQVPSETERSSASSCVEVPSPEVRPRFFVQHLLSLTCLLRPPQRFGFVDKMLTWNQAPDGRPVGPAIGPLPAHVQP